MIFENLLQMKADLIQIGTAFVITSWGRSFSFKSGQVYYKFWQVLQMEAIITNRCRTPSKFRTSNWVVFNGVYYITRNYGIVSKRISDYRANMQPMWLEWCLHTCARNNSNQWGRTGSCSRWKKQTSNVQQLWVIDYLHQSNK